MRAYQQLWAIHDYVAQTSPNYAKRLVDRLTRRSEQIGTFPMSGRAVPEYQVPQVREVIEGVYRIIYYIRPDQIDVIAVVHGAQSLEAEDVEAEDDSEG